MFLALFLLGDPQASGWGCDAYRLNDEYLYTIIEYTEDWEVRSDGCRIVRKYVNDSSVDPFVGTLTVVMTFSNPLD